MASVCRGTSGHLPRSKQRGRSFQLTSLIHTSQTTGRLTHGVVRGRDVQASKLHSPPVLSNRCQRKVEHLSILLVPGCSPPHNEDISNCNTNLPAKLLPKYTTIEYTLSRPAQVLRGIQHLRMTGVHETTRILIYNEILQHTWFTEGRANGIVQCPWYYLSAPASCSQERSNICSPELG